MNCPSCNKEVVADKFFCTWCETFIPNPQIGKKSGLVRRWFANAIDPFIAMLLIGLIAAPSIGLARYTGGLSFGVVVLAMIGYFIFFLWFLSKGMTLGKWILGERVFEKLTGNYPGFGWMLLRETIGKFISGIVLGLGFFGQYGTRIIRHGMTKLPGRL